jgi:hypothetical protein
VSGQEPLRKDYSNFNAKNEKANLLTADLDKPVNANSAGAINIQTPKDEDKN